MEALDVPDGSFDVSVSRYALHHAVDVAAVADELVRVVRPGGRIVVVDFAATTDRRAPPPTTRPSGSVTPHTSGT